MDLFNSLDNRYYRIFHSLLEQAHEKPLSRAEIVATIHRMGFAESTVCLADRLLDPDNPDALGVLQKDGPSYLSVLSAPPVIGRDLLELRWLKAILLEERSRMFLTPALMAEMEALLEDIDPLFPAEPLRRWMWPRMLILMDQKLMPRPSASFWRPSAVSGW